VLLPCLTSARAASPQAPDNRSCRADYRIEARVEPEARTLRGTAAVTWTNRTADVVGDVWFHLNHNAFANNGSTHLWEARGRLGGEAVEDGFGWQRIHSLRVGERELAPELRWERPDDGRAEDHTVFSVGLPDPVMPGGSVEIQVEWEALIPTLRRRTGIRGDFLLMAHWFPKLGVYEGGKGWNCHQFHMSTEFFSDYGTYDVTLDLPDRYAELVDDGEGKRVVPKVGASGAPVGSAVVEGGRLRVRFAAPAQEDRERVDPVSRGVADARPLVHGFAWTADPRFVVHSRVFDMEKWIASHEEDPALLERLRSELAVAAAAFSADPETFGLRPVEVVVLIHPEREGQWERHWEATCATLFFYGIWFGEYPYSRVTVVDPAWGAGAAGGMEYPTLFTCGTSLFTRAGMQRPESVVIHEAGHQFWYGLVGNNEYENAWLDEGFNSYTDAEVTARVYGPRRATTSYSGWPVWGEATAPDPAGEGTAGLLTGQRWDLGRLAGRRLVLAPLAASPFLDWWRDLPMLTFGEGRSDARWRDRTGYLAEPDADPVHTNGWEYLNQGSYRANSYARTAVALRSLSAVVGETAFRKGMRHYAEQWRYRHPYPDDFYAAFQQGAGVQVPWYFEELFEGTGTVDWSVTVEQRRAAPPRGFLPGDPERVDAEWLAAPAERESSVEEDGAAVPEVVDGAGTASEPTPEEGEDEAAQAAPLSYDVVVRRRGELCLPLAIEVTFDDDSVQLFQWTREAQLAARSTWWRLPIPPGKAEIERVLLDPERRYFLDGDMSDNQWYAQRDEVAPARWGERAFTQYVHLLHWFSSLGG